MEFIPYIQTQVQLTPQTVEELSKHTKIERYSKGDIIRNINSMSKKVLFFESGYARSFYLKESKDITSIFLTENSFSMAIESIYYNQGSRYGIEALEDVTVCSIQHSELQRINDHSPQMEKFLHTQLIKFIKLVSDKYYDIQLQSAQERYASMLKNYPDILLHAPLGHIASYLGITQETLSRIRSGK